MVYSTLWKDIFLIMGNITLRPQNCGNYGIIIPYDGRCRIYIISRRSAAWIVILNARS